MAGEPSTREHVLATMRAIVAGTEREDDLEELAERQLVEWEAWDALFWQPWRAPAIEGVSRERLLEAQGQGRGVILSGAHVGPFFAVSVALWELGIKQYVVMGNWYYEQPSHDFWGRRTARWRIGLPPLPVVRPRGATTSWPSCCAAAWSRRSTSTSRARRRRSSWASR